MWERLLSFVSIWDVDSTINNVLITENCLLSQQTILWPFKDTKWRAHQNIESLMQSTKHESTDHLKALTTTSQQRGYARWLALLIPGIEMQFPKWLTRGWNENNIVGQAKYFSVYHLIWIQIQIHFLLSRLINIWTGENETQLLTISALSQDQWIFNGIGRRFWSLTSPNWRLLY